MSKRKQNPGHVTTAECRANVRAMNGRLDTLVTKLKRVENALIGPDMKSGLVKNVNDLLHKEQSKLSTRDKIFFGLTLATALISLVIAIWK